MANIEHSQIADANLHETKGAAGATVGQVLEAVGNGTATFQTPLPNNMERLLDGASVATSQEPTAVDAALQIEFGPLIAGADVSLAADGTLTFVTAGTYLIRVILQYGRTGGAAVANLHVRAVSGVTQIGNTISASVDTAGLLLATSVDTWITATAGTTLVYQIVRDSSGANSGGLFLSNPTIAGWNNSPSAAIRVERLKHQ